MHGVGNQVNAARIAGMVNLSERPPEVVVSATSLLMTLRMIRSDVAESGG